MVSDPKNGRARIALAQMHYIAGDYTAARAEAEAARSNGVELPGSLREAREGAAREAPPAYSPHL